MKPFYIFLSVLLLFSACSPKQSKYPNKTTDQIFTQIPWGLNHSAVDKYLTEECKMVFSEEIPNLAPMRQYVYNGGRYNNIETKSWTVSFYDDSLIYVSLWVHEESIETREQYFNSLCELNDAEFSKDSTSTPEARRWFYESNGKRISNILFSNFNSSPKTKDFAVLLSRAH